MTAKFFLTPDEVKANVAQFLSFMNSNGLRAFYVSSFDQYINEYVPRPECWRYYVTGFTGSMAEVLVMPDGKIHLFVDGRYHEQADNEVDASTCVVHKCAFYPDILPAMRNLIEEYNVQKIGVASKRTPNSLGQSLFNGLEVVSFSDEDLKKFVSFKEYTFESSAYLLPESLKFESFSTKASKILKDGEAYFVSAMDSVSWISNIRAYQFPYQSSIAAKAFFTNKELHIFVPNTHLICDEIKKCYKVHDDSLTTMANVFSSLKANKVFFDSDKTSYADKALLDTAFGNILTHAPLGLVRYHSFKTENELNEFRKSFNSGDQAIFNTLKEVKEKARAGEFLSETQMRDLLENNYKDQGAYAQSFSTISGVGANGSIIHYSTPSSKMATKGDLYLLDSGGYFESGFATDTTRTVAIGDAPNEEQKRMYTLVLKGLLQVQNAIFPEGTWGAQLDSLARFQMRSLGYDYAHGTGHGVGINVHEGNFRLSPTSNIPLKAGQVGSIEPGIYIPGLGGVRLENIAIVQKHPTLKGMLRFENLVYIGFDHSLIDKELLTKQEKVWLEEYESECHKRGRSFL